jgi:hypothetical protein
LKSSQLQLLLERPRNLRVLIVVAFVSVGLALYLLQARAPIHTIRDYPQEPGSMLAWIVDTSTGSHQPAFRICAPDLNVPPHDPPIIVSGVYQTLDLSNHPRIVDRRVGIATADDQSHLQPGQIIRIIPVTQALVVRASEIQILVDNSQTTVPGCMSPSFGW